MTEQQIRLDELNRLSEWANDNLSKEIRQELALYVVGRVKELTNN